jgi:hypothetical protein
VEDIWVGLEHPWRNWVKRPLFAALAPEDEAVVQNGDAYVPTRRFWAAPPEWLADEKLALIIDLAGAEAIELGIALGTVGFRPVLMVNAASDIREAIDMRPVLRRLVKGARFAAAFPDEPGARPAFLLDSRRWRARESLKLGSFDNRWMLFPSDMPRAKHLAAQGIERVVLMYRSHVLGDVAAIMREYQREGLDVSVVDVEEPDELAPVLPRGRLAEFWGRLKRHATFQRNWDGSYGHRISSHG